MAIITNSHLYEEKYFIVKKKKENSVNNHIYHTIDRQLMLMTLNAYSVFRFNFDCIGALLYRSKINIYGVYVVKKETMKDNFIHFLRKGYVLLVTHTSKVANQIILMHQTVIMLKEIQTLITSTFKMIDHLIHSLLWKINRYRFQR